MTDNGLSAAVDTLDELTALAGVVLGQPDLQAALIDICQIAARAVARAKGASLTTVDRGRPTAVASDDWAQGLDELQFTEHEGPCLDAFRTGNAFRVADLAAETRWPFYAPRAAERGARSMVSLPLSAEGGVIGALNLYAEDPNAFDVAAVAVAEVIAAHAGLAIHVATAFFNQRDLADQLADAMQSRATIEQAKGILMGSQHCSAEEAFDLLVDLSSKSHRKLRDVAAVIVEEALKPPSKG